MRIFTSEIEGQQVTYGISGSVLYPHASESYQVDFGHPITQEEAEEDLRRNLKEYDTDSLVSTIEAYTN